MSMTSKDAGIWQDCLEQQNRKHSGCVGMAQGVKQLLCKCEALSSSPNPPNKKKQIKPSTETIH
jgi:hypothetical protein